MMPANVPPALEAYRVSRAVNTPRYDWEVVLTRNAPLTDRDQSKPIS